MEQALQQFHFSQPAWLWLVPLAGLGIMLWMQRKPGDSSDVRWRNFAEAALLPYLIRTDNVRDVQGSQRPYWIVGMIVVCLALAMAGPRWEYDTQPIFRKPQALVILLDLSASMSVSDVKPSRMARARQEVRDILDAARKKGVSVGLVGFAATAHVLSPITEGVNSIEQMLPILDPGLFRRQGSDPLGALRMATDMMQRYAEQTGLQQGHVVLITDGDMSEALQPLMREIDGVNEKGPAIALHILAVGTEEGQPIVGPNGRTYRNRQGNVHISRMERAGLEKLAARGGGMFMEAGYLSQDTQQLMQHVLAGENKETLTKSAQRIWQERYRIPLICGMLLLMLGVPAWPRRRA